jgi:hypothetical protein
MAEADPTQKAVASIADLDRLERRIETLDQRQHTNFRYLIVVIMLLTLFLFVLNVAGRLI